MFGLTALEILVIAILFIISLNVIVSNLCSTSALNILRKKRSLVKAIGRLKIFDRYVLSKLLIISAFLFYWSSYNFVSSLTSSAYVVFFALLLSFALILVTSFLSRLSYCYVANILLDSKLDEKALFLDGLKKLLIIYFPFVVFSLFIPTFLNLDLTTSAKVASSSIFIFSFILIWILYLPNLLVLMSSAKLLDNPAFKDYFSGLFSLHGIKRYDFYVWDDYNSKDDASFVQGVKKYRIFLSEDLLHSSTIEEMKAVLLLEIGRIKNNNYLSIKISNALMIFFIGAIFLLSYFFDLNNVLYASLVVLLIIAFFVNLFYVTSVQRVFENEADVYARQYTDNDEAYISASAKMKKYRNEELERKAIEEIFNKYPSLVEKYKNSSL